MGKGRGLAQESLTDMVKIKQRLEGSRTQSMQISEGEMFLPEGKASRAKVLRKEHDWCVPGTARRPVWLEQSDGVESGRNEVRKRVSWGPEKSPEVFSKGGAGVENRLTTESKSGSRRPVFRSSNNNSYKSYWQHGLQWQQRRS